MQRDEKSTEGYFFLSDSIEFLILNSGKKLLVSHMPVRWNSFYAMLNRANEMKDALVLFLASYKDDDSEKLSNDEWTLIEELIVVFRPLYTATLELSGEKFTTLSKVLPLTTKLLEIYSTKPNPNDSPQAKEVRKMIHDSLKNQFKDVETNETITNATIFDPRFKDYFFKKSKCHSAISAAKLDALSEASDCVEEPVVTPEASPEDDDNDEPTMETEEVIFIKFYNPTFLPTAHQCREVRNRQEGYFEQLFSG